MQDNSTFSTELKKSKQSFKTGIHNKTSSSKANRGKNHTETAWSWRESNWNKSQKHVTSLTWPLKGSLVCSSFKTNVILYMQAKVSNIIHRHG